MAARGPQFTRNETKGQQIPFAHEGLGRNLPVSAHPHERPGRVNSGGTEGGWPSYSSDVGTGDRSNIG